MSRRKNYIKPYASIDLLNNFQKKIQHNPQHLGSDDAQFLRNYSADNFFNFINGFYIFGDYPWGKRDEPNLLFAYPSNNNLLASKFSTFCLPYGLGRSRVRCDLISCAYDKNQIDESEFFTLYFPENNEAPYLFCLRFRANPLTMPTICHSFSIFQLLEHCNAYNMPYCNFCLAIQTKYPNRSLFSKFLKWILISETTARLQISNVLDSFYSGDLISNIIIWPETQHNSFLECIGSFFSRSAPQELEKLLIDKKPYPIFEWTVPQTSNVYYPMVSRCLFRVISLLNITNFWKLYSAMLLERSIIIYHPKQKVVCDTIISLHFLIKPLIWACSTISILPPSLYDLLNIPNPIIIGTSEPMNEINCGWVLVDLDKNSIFTDEEIIAHPKMSNFFADFSRKYSYIKNEHKKDTEALIEILEACNSYVKEMIDLLNKSIITDFSDPLNVQSKFFEEMYLQFFEHDERDFYHNFCTSQMAMLHIEQLCRKSSDDKKIDVPASPLCFSPQ